MQTADILPVVLGYLLGSIPSAYILGRLNQVNLAETGDGELGASLAFRRLGIISGTIVTLMDFGKGIAAVAVAHALDAPRAIVMLAGFAAVIGHNWSLWLGFKGGRGTLAAYGVMAALGFWQFAAAVVLAAAVFYFVRKSTLVTVLLFGVLTVILNIQGALSIPEAPQWQQPWFVLFPMALLVPGFVKHMQTRRQKPRASSPGDGTLSQA
jgi:acyl phosphate:glycerol-3-phosphate acyltransferase